MRIAPAFLFFCQARDAGIRFGSYMPLVDGSVGGEAVANSYRFGEEMVVLLIGYARGVGVELRARYCVLCIGQVLSSST